MDEYGIDKGLIGVGAEVSKRALADHPDRFVGSIEVDPNDITKAVRRIRTAHEEYGIKAVTTFPSGCNPPVPVSDRRYYPIYQTCIDLGLPIVANAGIAGPRLPSHVQDVMHFDQVCYDFPELVIVMRHGAEPWEALAVKLMLKWPGLHYMTSAFAPKYYPRAIIDYANTRGADKIMYAGYYPMGLSLERIFTEMPEVPFRDHVWAPFLRENAAAGVQARCLTPPSATRSSRPTATPARTTRPTGSTSTRPGGTSSTPGGASTPTRSATCRATGGPATGTTSAASPSRRPTASSPRSIFPNTVPPFFPTGAVVARPPTPEELPRRLAGIRAHNRWLVEFCGRHPERRAGIAQIFLNDVDEAIADVEFAAANGLRGGVLLPAVPPDTPHIEPLYSTAYDPLWAACEELGVVLNHHSGGGAPDYGRHPGGRHGLDRRGRRSGPAAHSATCSWAACSSASRS